LCDAVISRDIFFAQQLAVLHCIATGGRQAARGCGAAPCAEGDPTRYQVHNPVLIDKCTGALPLSIQNS
jgi:hypothetical protein